MKELLMTKTGKNSPLLICQGEDGQLLYGLYPEEEGIWSRSCWMKNEKGDVLGRLEYKHEAFRLAKMPRIKGYLGDREVFLVKRELEQLQDKVELESETLQLEGDVPAGNFRLYQGGSCVGRYQYKDGQMKLQTEGEELLTTLLAFALECF